MKLPMTDKQDLIREILEYVTTHGGENTATHLLVQAASAIQAQAAELEAVGAGGVQALSAAPAGFVPVAAFDRLHAHAESLAARLLAAEQAAPKAAPGEPSDWKPLKTSKEGRDAVRSFFREKLKRQDFDEYIMGTLAADFACVLGGYLRAEPQQEAQEPVALLVRKNSWRAGQWEAAPPDSPSYGLAWANQRQYVYAAPQPAPAELERLKERISRMGLDVDRAMRGHVNEQSPLGTQRLAAIAALAKPAPAPLSDDVVKDAARWRMAVLIGNEVMLHPEKRTHATAVKAYMDATHGGSDLTGAVDAAIAAQERQP